MLTFHAHRRIVLVGEHRVKEYMIAFLLLRDARRVHGAGSGLVLPVLEAGLIPMFLIIGIRGEPCLCVVQILPLYLPRVGIDAGGGGRHVFGGWYRQTFHPDGLPVWHR
jgi:hypothetical protein